MLETPVAFFIFNRPDTTRRVFEEIARAKPRQLLIVADGPRNDRPGEAERCAETRSIVEKVNWECEVIKNYSGINLGCKRRVSSGLNWVFDQCLEAIILEDDCLPHPSFFRFCSELLTAYRHDDRVMTISGNNFQFGKKRGNGSYYFSRYPHIWGWASWRRAWKFYDVNMLRWPELRDTDWLHKLLNNPEAARYWHSVINQCFDNRVDTWDVQWVFSCWQQSGLVIIPNINMVANIGFGEDATHTKEDIYELGDLQALKMTFPLIHPEDVEANNKADQYTFRRIFARDVYRPTLGRRIVNYIFSKLPKGFKAMIKAAYRSN